MRGDDRRPRPAAPPRQGHRLGHRRVLDAAAGDRRADRPRVGQGPDRRPDARDPAADRPVAARRGRPDAARRADDHRSTATSSRPTAGRGPPRSPAATSRWRRRSSRTAWSGTSSARSRRSRSGSSTASPLLDLDYSEDSRADVDFNVVGTDAGHVRRAAGHRRGQAVRPGGDDGLLDLADSGLGTLFEAQAAGARHGPAVSAVPIRRLVVATRSAHKLRELRELLDLPAHRARLARRPRRRGRPGRGRRDVRDERRDQGALRGAGDRPADAGRRLRPRGRRARRRAGRPDPALRRRGRDRRRQQREAARGAATACRPSDAARATCASSRSPARTTPGRAAAIRVTRAAGRAAAGSRPGRAGRAGSATTRSSSRLRAARRPDARPVDGRREERDLAPRRAPPAGCAADAPRARVLRRCRRDLRVLRRERRAGSGLRRLAARRSATGSPSAGSGSSTAAAGVGLMGVVADAALAAGGEVIGVIPPGWSTASWPTPG